MWPRRRKRKKSLEIYRPAAAELKARRRVAARWRRERAIRGNMEFWITAATRQFVSCGNSQKNWTAKSFVHNSFPDDDADGGRWDAARSKREQSKQNQNEPQIDIFSLALIQFISENVENTSLLTLFPCISRFFISASSLYRFWCIWQNVSSKRQK